MQIDPDQPIHSWLARLIEADNPGDDVFVAMYFDNEDRMKFRVGGHASIDLELVPLKECCSACLHESIGDRLAEISLALRDAGFIDELPPLKEWK